MNDKREAHYIPAVLALLLMVAGCAPPFPKDLLEKVSPNVSFQALKENPDKHKGALVMLGGMIVDAKNLKEGTVIEVLQKPLDSGARPLNTDATEGRFIITSEKFLDAAVYHRGRLITVIGEVIGRKTQPLGDVEYQYPLISAKDLHLWAPSSVPRFYFGIGVSKQL